MAFDIVVAVLAVAALTATVVAFKKHGSLTAVLASAKREASYLEALIGKVEADAKADYAAIVARLKALKA